MNTYKITSLKKIPSSSKVKKFSKLTAAQKAATPAKNEKYPWAKLAVGQAFKITNTTLKMATVQRTKRKAQNKYGASFLVQKETSGFRIVRIA